MNAWSESEILYLKNNYLDKTISELSDYLGRSVNAIHLKASRLGFKKSKYHYDKSFFKVIDSEEKAYWLGFMYADGYVIEKRENRNWEAGIQLRKSDYKHLKKFNKSLNGNVDVSFVLQKGHFLRSRLIEDTICSKIRFYCKEMVEDLISHGVVPAKSLIKEAPIGVPDELLKHFLRGYFDGNGTLCFSLNKKVKIRYLRVFITTGSKCFADWLSSTFKNIGFDSYIAKDNREKHAFKVYVKSKYALNFLDYIYKDSNIYLDRKYDLYKSAVPSKRDK